MYHITYIIRGCSIHNIEVLFQDKRGESSLGFIFLVVKVLDFLKETINHGNKIYFGTFVVIKVPLTLIWCERLVSKPTTTFKKKFYPFLLYFILLFKDRVNTTTASIEFSFRLFHPWLAWCYCNQLFLSIWYIGILMWVFFFLTLSYYLLVSILFICREINSLICAPRRLYIFVNSSL